MKKWYVILLVSVLMILSACGNEETEGTGEDSGKNDNQVESGQLENEKDVYPQLTSGGTTEETVVMETTAGNIELTLYPELAPKAVENFIQHAKDGYYDGVTFHRVIKDFMIQGGDPEGTGMGGESIWGEPFEDEFSQQLFHFRGALSMANSGADTNGSQFFIVQNQDLDPALEEQLKEAGYPSEVIAAYTEQGGTPHLDQVHTVFGQVKKGMDVVDAIAAVEVDADGRPADKIVINKITVK